MFVYATFDSCLCLDFSNHSTTVDVLDVKLAIESRCGVPVKEQLVLIDGKVLSNEQCFDESTEVFCQVKLRGLLGGKGGFGSVSWYVFFHLSRLKKNVSNSCCVVKNQLFEQQISQLVEI